ncbi:PAS domain S-box protein [Streptomyces kaempferi]
MVIVDDTGTIRLVNAQTESLFGYQREELLGHPVEILVPSRFHAQHTHHRNGYANNRQVRPMGAGLELNGLRKDGTEFPVEISLSPSKPPTASSSPPPSATSATAKPPKNASTSWPGSWSPPRTRSSPRPSTATSRTGTPPRNSCTATSRRR